MARVFLLICPSGKKKHGHYAQALRSRQEKDSSIFASQIRPHQRSDIMPVYWPDTEPCYMQVERSRVKTVVDATTEAKNVKRKQLDLWGPSSQMPDKPTINGVHIDLEEISEQ